MIAFSVRISILISLALLLAAQALFLSPALIAVLGIIWLYLLYTHLKPNRKVKKIWTVLLVTLALASIYFSHKTFIGVDAGVSVLITFLFAKALETKNQRDAIVLFNFALFVSASSFLFSQSFVMAVIILCCMISNFVGLYRIQTSAFATQQAPIWHSLKQDLADVGKCMAYALPFFVLLFLFFPRLPPLWHIPIPENKAVTGISDSMSPGEIAELSQSSELAFRVLGDMQKMPIRTDLYWRAMALDDYDGQRWTSSPLNQQIIPPEPLSTLAAQPMWQYQYLPADPKVQWIMGLEQSIAQSDKYLLSFDGRITPRRMTLKTDPIALHWIQQQALLPLNPQQMKWMQLHNTAVRRGLDLKSQKLAQQLFAQSQNDTARYIQNVLAWYKKQGFAYTLKPGVLGENRIDDFLFGTRQGFCEHYASSFTMLMRYAGIPARVVVGYQGGQLAPDRQSWEVRQLDAHAWTEVWVNGKWVRYDPTAIIAPNRIDLGMQNYLENDQSAFGSNRSEFAYRQYAFMTQLRIWSDYASYQWQSKVVGYNAESQRSWFQKIGLDSVYSGVFSLMAGIFSLVLLYFSYIFWNLRQQKSVLDHAIDQFNAKLNMELQQRRGETFSAWMERLAKHVPVEDKHHFQLLKTKYEHYRYMMNGQENMDVKEITDLLKTCSFVIKKVIKNLV